MYQLDMKTAFLNGIHEECLCGATCWLCEGRREGMVCKLKKALHGLTQAPRARYKQIDEHLMKKGYVKACMRLHYIEKGRKSVNMHLLVCNLYRELS